MPKRHTSATYSKAKAGSGLMTNDRFTTTEVLIGCIISTSKNYKLIVIGFLYYFIAQLIDIKELFDATNSLILSTSALIFIIPSFCAAAFLIPLISIHKQTTNFYLRVIFYILIKVLESIRFLTEKHHFAPIFYTFGFLLAILVDMLRHSHPIELASLTLLQVTLFFILISVFDNIADKLLIHPDTALS